MLTKADITKIKSLGEKKSRLEHGLFTLEGHKIISEVKDSDFEIENIYTTQQDADNEHVSPKEMARISQLKTPTDCLAVVKIPSYKLNFDELNNSLILALDNVQDPGNLGTIIRIADWFGIKDILCSHLSADCYNPKVVQASMGAILRVRVHYTNLEEALSKITSPIYGTFLEGDNIYNHSLSANGVIVMGNEGRGISEVIEAKISSKLYIPPYPKNSPSSESLNVATATSIVCSEFRRRV
ncbi:MAG: RNA methyltransferase [Rikenellaceae bacterium]